MVESNHGVTYSSDELHRTTAAIGYRTCAAYLSVMPIARRLFASSAAAGTALLVAVLWIYSDIATDTSGEAMDAAARGAPALPIVFTVLLGVYFAQSRIAPFWENHPYWSGVGSAAAASGVLVPWFVWLVTWHGPFEPLLAFELAAGGLALCCGWLFPGALVQVWIMERHNRSFERTRRE